MTEPCDLSATVARALIGTRRLSPVELTYSSIRRIEEVDPAVNAMVARDFFPPARSAAARAAETQVMRGEELGALHGLPLGVKDLIDARGSADDVRQPDLQGQHRHQGRGRGGARCRSAGAIVIGKTNTAGMGRGRQHAQCRLLGADRHPVRPDQVGGRLVGVDRGVALACGMVPLATGSDTGGWCRNPAAFCGVVGLRPTLGLIPSERQHRRHGSSSRQLGPMARTGAGPLPDVLLR